jgi:hypothetical protein
LCEFFPYFIGRRKKLSQNVQTRAVAFLLNWFGRWLENLFSQRFIGSGHQQADTIQLIDD